MTEKYKYLGDRISDPQYKGRTCEAVRRKDGKCIRGKNGSMLVKFSTGETAVVIARLLRKIKDDMFTQGLHGIPDTLLVGKNGFN